MSGPVAQDPDELYTLRNRFWLGDFQMAIAEGNNLTRLKDESLKIERDEFVYRSYIGLGQYGIVLNEIKEGAPLRLQAIKLLASYLDNPEANRESALKQCEDYLAKYGHSKTESTLQLVCCLIFDRENENDKAFKAIMAQSTVEQLAMWAQLCLKIWRPELAQAHYEKLMKIDEDAPLTQLVGAWVHLAHGGDKIKEAAFAYEELIDKFDASISLLNGVAACHMHLQEWEDAEKYLLQALSKGNAAETLVNLLAVSIHLGKEQEVQDRYVAQLKNQYPNHPAVLRMIRCEEAFDRVSAQMKQSADLKTPIDTSSSETKSGGGGKNDGGAGSDDDDDDM